MWYTKRLAKKEYVGDCVNCLEDDWFNNNIASDATELAQVSDHFEENEDIQEIDFKTFIQLCNVSEAMVNSISNNPHDYEFYINNYHNLAWIYEINTDTHHFYF